MATWTRTESGWRAKTSPDVRVGDVVRIRAKSGAVTVAHVTGIVTSGPHYAVCKVDADPRSEAIRGYVAPAVAPTATPAGPAVERVPGPIEAQGAALAGDLGTGRLALMGAVGLAWAAAGLAWGRCGSCGGGSLLEHVLRGAWAWWIG